jgi:hypothetical protein
MRRRIQRAGAHNKRRHYQSQCQTSSDRNAAATAVQDCDSPLAGREGSRTERPRRSLASYWLCRHSSPARTCSLSLRDGEVSGDSRASVDAVVAATTGVRGPSVGAVSAVEPGDELVSIELGYDPMASAAGCGVSKLGARPKKSAICRQDTNFGTPQAHT